MPSSSVFSWLDGRGWLVFSGGADDDIRASAFNRAAADGGMAVIGIGIDAEALLLDLEDMGAPAGYLVDPAADEDPVVLDKLNGAGFVLVTGAQSVREVRTALAGAPLEGMQYAFERGAVVLVEGVAVEAFGTWLVENDLRDGLKWLDRIAFVISDMFEATVRRLLAEMPLAVVISIMPGSAIAFGPDGQIEIWGAREVVIRLGSAYGGQPIIDEG